MGHGVVNCYVMRPVVWQGLVFGATFMCSRVQALYFVGIQMWTGRGRVEMEED